MSDFERSTAGRPFSGAMTSAEAAAVDAGLRAHMLSIYNYMVLGLAITGVAAFGAYALSVTGDVATAAKISRDGIDSGQWDDRRPFQEKVVGPGLCSRVEEWPQSSTTASRAPATAAARNSCSSTGK